MSFYEFQEQDAYDFARMVGIQVRQRGDELFFRTCPYCRPATLKGNTETFAINLRTGVFKCLRASCGVSGNMITLSRDFDFSLGTMADEYYKPRKNYRKLKTPKEPIKPQLQAVRYLEGRGISAKIAEKYEITAHKDHANTLVFPFFDEKGKLQFLKYRDMKYFKGKTYINKNGEEKKSPKEWGEKKCKPILFGMKQCEDFGQLIICEGQIDSLSVTEAGIKNAVSVPNGANGFTWLPYCWNWINKFSEIVVFGDYEKGRITLLNEISKRVKITVKHVREEDYKDCKDANEILLKYGREQVSKCVENAVIVPIRQVVDLADVEDVDVAKIPKLKTGINQVDSLLYGGLPFGCVTVISGKPGGGKSTLASQILANALCHEYKCFAYSGELPAYLFKAWLDFQIAGGKHITSRANAWGGMDYIISKNNKALLADWYRGKCFLYDNSQVYEEELESLVTVAENTIRQYGVQVLLLDNLMTALDLEMVYDKNDKYERQSIFMKRLARLALQYNVLILLVAHKRKNNRSTDENDEVSGSGDIINLGSVTISYDKNDELQPEERLCKISKNRLYGRTETKGYVLNYDERSKRIYGFNDDVNADYGWNPEDSAFFPINEEMPFDQLELEGIE